MGFVSSIFARRMVQAAGTDVDGPAFLRSVGLDPDAGLDVEQRLADDVYYDLLERIAARLPDAHHLPLRVGPLMRLDDYGALGLAWKAARTVRGSLERVERFCRLWTDNMTYQLRDRPDGGIDFVLHRTGPRRLGLRLSNESTAASAVSLIRQSAHAAFQPRAVTFQHQGPGSTAAHQRYFGCPVRFAAAEDAITIAGHDLARPNHLADDGISRFLLSHLESAIETVGPESIEAQVRHVVSRSLSEGVLRMGEVARRLGMSERTLHRRLAGDGLTFKAVAEAARRQLAQDLLQQSRYSLAEVAFLTGFSEQSAFTRAFKRWAGQTPADYRRDRT